MIFKERWSVETWSWRNRSGTSSGLLVCDAIRIERELFELQCGSGWILCCPESYQGSGSPGSVLIGPFA